MSIADFFNVSVTVKKKGATATLYGRKTDGADIVVKVRLQESRNLTLEIAGREVSVDAVLYAPPDADITDQDRIVMPDDPSQPMEVLRVKRTRHGDGTVHHLKVECGRTQRGRVS